MSTCLYLVIHSLGAWWVDCEGKPYGPCDTAEEAMRAAHKLIGLFCDPERHAEIWAPDESGKMRLVWAGKPNEAEGMAFRTEGDSELSH